jgi:hypothetical protein
MTIELLLRHLTLNRNLINDHSLLALFRFLLVATRLKNDIILMQPSTVSDSKPPSGIPPSIKHFLAASCHMPGECVDNAWLLFKEVIWAGHFDTTRSEWQEQLDAGWELHGKRCGLGMGPSILFP